MNRLQAVAMLAVLAGLATAQAPSAPSWTQMGGDVYRSSVVDLAGGPLDVVAFYDMLTQGGAGDGAVHYGGATPGLVHTPYGLAGVAYTPDPSGAGVTDSCVLMRLLDPFVGEVETFGEPVPCSGGGRMSGYDPVSDTLVTCFDGLPLRGDQLLYAFDARTGAERWRAAPDVSQAEVPGQGDNNDWFCEGAVVDGDAGVAYVGYSSDIGRNRIEAVRLADGGRLWSTALAFHDYAVAPIALPGEVAAAESAFTIFGLTRTDTGLVVRGIGGVALPPPPVAAPLGPGPFAVALLGFDGRLVASYVAGDPRPGQDAVDNGWSAGSSYATGSGPFAVAAIQDGLLLVDPGTAAVTRIAFPEWEALPPGAFPAGPAWSRTHLVVPLVATVEILDASDWTRSTTWSGLSAGFVWAVVVDDADAYVVMARFVDGVVRHELIRVDLATGRSVQRHEYDVGPGVPGGFPFSGLLVPLPEGRGFLDFGAFGDTVVLAQADPSRIPRAVLDDDYPAAGQEVRLALPADGQAFFRVAWGDGATEVAEPGATVTHAYSGETRRTLRVTAVFPDNLTGTQELAVHVGEQRPQELNFIQRAFAPEAQNVTFGVLGLAATGIGAVVAVVARARRRSVLDGELGRLDAAVREGRRDALAGLTTLGALEGRWRKGLSEGDLDDAQFGVLESRAARARSALRERVVALLRGRASDAFARALDEAIADGHVVADEAVALRRALAAEAALPDGERAKLDGLVAAWEDERR